MAIIIWTLVYKCFFLFWQKPSVIYNAFISITSQKSGFTKGLYYLEVFVLFQITHILCWPNYNLHGWNDVPVSDVLHELDDYSLRSRPDCSEKQNTGSWNSGIPMLNILCNKNTLLLILLLLQLQNIQTNLIPLKYCKRIITDTL